MSYFNGRVTIKVCEAVDLKPTDFATRHAVGVAKGSQAIDPYVQLNIDDLQFAKSTIKPKTCSPIWNEEFETKARNAQNLGFTVFHNSALPPDQFVANCALAFDDLLESSDLWVSNSQLFRNIQLMTFILKNSGWFGALRKVTCHHKLKWIEIGR